MATVEDNEYGTWELYHGNGSATVNVLAHENIVGMVFAGPVGYTVEIGDQGVIDPQGNSLTLNPKGNVQGPLEINIVDATFYLIEITR